MGLKQSWRAGSHTRRWRAPGIFGVGVTVRFFPFELLMCTKSSKFYNNSIRNNRTHRLLPIVIISTTFDPRQETIAMAQQDDDDGWRQRSDKPRRSTVAVVAAAGTLIAAIEPFLQLLLDQAAQEQEPKQKMRRRERRMFDYRGAYNTIWTNLLDENALYSRDFEDFFRLSRSRVERKLQDFGNSGGPFYQRSFRVDMCGREGVSLKAKVLLPLTAIAHGTSPHCLCVNYQVSQAMARKMYRVFLETIQKIYGDEYTRTPTAKDLKAICTLHRRVHGVSGMLGSLDCMLTKWKNCPMEWQGVFKGREKSMSTIVMEAVCDYYLWFWRVCYGNPGSMNDSNVLDTSPLLEMLLNRSYVKVEQEAGVVPYYIPGEDQPFHKTFLLVDGAYPKYCRFVRTINPPITQEEKNFSRWQEGARKDIERAFGVLQCRFKAMCTPILSSSMVGATNLTACCIILHNMGVSDRIMKDVNARYDPSKVAEGGGMVPSRSTNQAPYFPPGVDGSTAPGPPIEVEQHRENLLQSFQGGGLCCYGSPKDVGREGAC
jgi:hypothetical protein